MAKSAVRREGKKTELVSVAKGLFLEKVEEETSVDAILKSSGLSKDGFSLDFRSKDEGKSRKYNACVMTLVERTLGVERSKLKFYGSAKGKPRIKEMAYE